MAGGPHRGIADDADDYAELDLEASPAGGIADDADHFLDLHEDAAGSSRSLDSPWLYRLEGAVFGPVSAKELLELLYAGEIDAQTEVAPEDGDFLAVERFGAFKQHLVEADRARAARQRERARADAEARSHRRRRLRWAGMFALVAAVGSAGVYGVVRWRRWNAAQTARADKEARLEAEMATLLDGVSIEPPLRPLVSRPARSHPSKRRRPKSSASERTAPSASQQARRRPPAAPASGPLTDQEVVDGVQRAFSGLVDCIKAQLRRDQESIPATIVLRFSIDNDGRVGGVTFEDRFLRRSQMKPCFEKQLERARWRAFEGEVRNVDYPIRVRRPS